MSLNSIMNTATLGMQTAQTQLRVVSDNVSNVNTPGYVRKIADQQSLSTMGIGSGVEVARIRLATDKFLQAASFNAGSEAARQGVRYELYDRIQALFGDPGGDSSFFARIDEVFSAFASGAEDPVSSPRRQDALIKAQAIFDEASRLSINIQAVRQDADGRIQTATETANSLLQQIEGLNQEIARARAVSSDASGAETRQAALIGQLAELMDIRVTDRAVGGVSIRTGSGVLLAGEGYATLSYQRAGTVTGETSFNEIWITEPHGQKRPLLDSLSSGEIKGLVELRDVESVEAAARLGELVTRVADELNRAHNANSAVPAPNSLTGRNLGQTFETAIEGFTGGTSIAVVNASGTLQARADIVFNGATMTINGAAASPATFLSVLNTQLGGAATASFVDGRLSITATASGNGIAMADDPANPSAKADRGFSHYFGLNDLISTNRPALYETGMTLASAHGFAAGQTMTLRLTSASGSRLQDVAFAVPAGGTMADLVTALNDPITGAGRHGSFVLDSQGALSFRPNTPGAISLSVLDDRTSQAPSGVSISSLFGLGAGVRASRADGFSLRTDIRQNPGRLALAQLNWSAVPGDPALSVGDGRGALALADAGQRSSLFQAAGDSAGGNYSVSRYAAELSGEIGGRAAASSNRSESAGALYTEAKARQVAKEGVNLDEELVMMTTYQQAFNASARMIQAVKELYDVLIGMV